MLSKLGVDTTSWNELSNARKSMLPIPGLAFHLLPVGAWILEESGVIRDFARWRFAARDSFFARFPESAKSMESFLKTRYINSNDAQLFVILDDQDRLVGHLGIKDWAQGQATIDSVMKSDECKVPGVMGSALGVLIEWAEAQMGVDSINLKVISTNTRAIKLYVNSGFRMTDSSALSSFQAGFFETLQEVTDSLASVTERSITMNRERQTPKSSDDS